MSDRTPVFRLDISVDVHQENNEDYIILRDPFDAAEGPIMVHADMMEILELCDGDTTWEKIAQDAGVDVDGAELMRARAFVSQLDEMGYFETSIAAKKRQDVLDQWHALESRPPVCAGSTYPADPAELRLFLESLCAIPAGAPGLTELGEVSAIFLPHIDYRVAGDAYAHAVEAMKHADPELVVMIGTSHYWSGDPVIGLDKHLETPLGTLHTDRALMQQFVDKLREKGLPVWDTDLAHKPEHALELHAVLIQHVYARKDLTVLPLLVTGSDISSAADWFSLLEQMGSLLHDVVEATGRRVLWLISGDLAHVGLRFGHDQHASAILPSSQQNDEIVQQALETGSAERVHQAIMANGNKYNICGHAPAVLALHSAQPSPGTLRSYRVWDDTPTHSAVSFAVIAYPANAAHE